jgi:hypothetical protein
MKQREVERNYLEVKKTGDLGRRSSSKHDHRVQEPAVKAGSPSLTQSAAPQLHARLMPHSLILFSSVL